MQLTSFHPGKQRLALYEEPLHLARRRLSCHLSDELKKQLNRRALTVRVKDTVKVMRGKFNGRIAKITGIDISSGRVLLEKVTRKKSDGSEIQVPLTTSNLLLVDLDRTDKRRLAKPEKQKKEQRIQPIQTRRERRLRQPKTTQKKTRKERRKMRLKKLNKRKFFVLKKLTRKQKMIFSGKK